MDQLGSNINKNIPDTAAPDDINVEINSPVDNQVDPVAMIQNRGFNVDPEKVAEQMDQVTATPINQLAEEETAVPEPVSTPKPNDLDIIGEEEAAERGIAGEGVPVDLVKEGIANDMAKYQQIQKEKQQDMVDGFEDMLKAENARLERMEATVNDPELAEKLIGSDNKVVRETLSQEDKEERKKDNDRYVDPIADDLVPTYDDDDPEPEPETPVEDEEDVDLSNNPQEIAQRDFIRELEVSTVEAEEPTPVEIIRERRLGSDTIGGKKNVQLLNDQAFLNSITRFKKDNFGKVTVPLINSGFYVDIVGTGVVDLQELYLGITRDTDPYEYELNQMHTVIKSVTGTHPTVDSHSLAGMIHYQDFQMMAYAHVCATLKKIEAVTNCQHCSKPFRITASTQELLLNKDEVMERAQAINAAQDIDKFSLMSHYHTINFNSGIVVTLGHPSYQEVIRSIRTFQSKKDQIPEVDYAKFENMLSTLYMIRKVHLPNNVDTTNIYQIFVAIRNMLSVSDMDVIRNELRNMRKEVIVPKFGIREVRCPHCKQINKNVPFEGLLDLLFYHTTISRYLKKSEG